MQRIERTAQRLFGYPCGFVAGGCVEADESKGIEVDGELASARREFGPVEQASEAAAHLDLRPGCQFNRQASDQGDRLNAVHRSVQGFVDVRRH